ncbi:hypothetical protein KAU32_06855 [bacterium]|nr:hypothetical protein [bacterium]
MEKVKSKDKVFLLKNVMIWLLGISFAFIEAAVVIYIRFNIHPKGFSFPLDTFLPYSLFRVEYCREIATMLLLFSISYLIAKTKKQWFSYFFILFGIWDIFYYVFLKIFLNWPETLGTWDLLFLIPVNWIGPVWAPILVSMIFISLGYLLIKLPNKLNLKFFIAFFVGCLFIYVSFTLDFTKYLIQNRFFENSTFTYALELSANYVPAKFPIVYFLIGIVCLMISPISLISGDVKRIVQKLKG